MTLIPDNYRSMLTLYQTQEAIALIKATVEDYLRKALNLKRPSGWSYRQTAAYGHFGRSCFPWEKTDQAKTLPGAISDYLNRRDAEVPGLAPRRRSQKA